ncbi:MAG TPA: alpha/beta hydrolase [Mycobacteriales bacterium]
MPTRIVDHERPHGHIPGAGGVPLHAEAYGSGDPVTVFAAGLGGTIPETRTLASGVGGTRVFYDVRGHGGSGVPADGDWSYAALAGDLRAVAGAYGATRAVGVSMGAAAMLGVLAAAPDRFTHCVFFLPAILDTARSDVATTRLGRLAARIDSGDVAAVEELLAAELPAPLRSSPEVVAYVRARAATLSGPGVAGLVRCLVSSAPVASRAALAPVTARCLVVGQEGDEVHPARLARELAEALPGARLHVFGTPGGLWAHRRELRSLVGEFLA